MMPRHGAEHGCFCSWREAWARLAGQPPRRAVGLAVGGRAASSLGRLAGVPNVVFDVGNNDRPLGDPKVVN